MSGTTSVNRPAAPVTAPTRPDPEIRKVHDLVGDQGLFGTDRNDHLHTIQNDLKELDGSRVNATLDGLSSGDLKKLGDNLDHGGIWGAQGLDGGERRAFFDNLAGKAGGAQLAKLSDGLSRDDKQMLAQSIATRAPPQAALDYIRAMAPGTTRQDDKLDAGFSGSTIVAGSPEAKAVGTVLSSLRGTTADAGFNSLSRNQLGAVVKAASTPTTTTTISSAGGAPSSFTTTSYDTKPLASLIGAAASGTDPVMKAHVFEAGSGVVGDIQSGDTLLTPDVTADDETRRATAALTGLLNSDATGTVNALNTDQDTGRSLATYAKAMVKEDRIADLGQIMGKLQHGNDGHERDSAKFFEQTATSFSGKPYYANAQNLGYFSGAVEAGINSISSDRNTQANSLRTFFTSALFSANASFPATPQTVPLKIAIPIINGLTGQAISDVTASLVAGDRSMRDAFNELAMPRLGTSQERYRGPAEDSFDATQAHVVTQN